MPQSFDPVFNDWYTGKCIGNGTDGRVYEITRNIYGKTQRSVLKTIRISDNRNENKGYNNINDIQSESHSDDFLKIIDDITTNIDTIREVDGGKHFVKYEEWDVRDTSDKKGKIILIRLEEMRSLTNVLDKFSFTCEETIRLGISVCKALIRCRDFGYVYPNLKPENILFDRKGICKLGDFGSFSSLEPAKSSVAFKRTEYYMAPEFMRTGKINCTCDTYALGLVLYMLVNRGRLPFTEPYPQDVTVNGLNKSRENRLKGLPLPSPATGTEELFKVIEKACSYKVEDRYLSPKQMLSDLKAVLEHKPNDEPVFDEIYSDSAQNDSTEEKETYVQYKNATDPFEEKIKLHEEITIPDIEPYKYANNDVNTPVRKNVATYSQLPKITSVKKHGIGNIKAVLGIIIAIAIILFMLIVSVALRLTSDELRLTEAVITNAFTDIFEVIYSGC